MPKTKGDFGYEIHDDKVEIWNGDKLLSTLSEEDDYVFTWTLIQYQQTLPKTLRVEKMNGIELLFNTKYSYVFAHSVRPPPPPKKKKYGQIFFIFILIAHWRFFPIYFIFFGRLITHAITL